MILFYVAHMNMIITARIFWFNLLICFFLFLFFFQLWILWWMLKEIWKCKCLEAFYWSLWLPTPHCAYWKPGLISWFCIFLNLIWSMAIYAKMIVYIGLLFTWWTFSLTWYLGQHPCLGPYTGGNTCCHHLWLHVLLSFLTI